MKVLYFKSSYNQNKMGTTPTKIHCVQVLYEIQIGSHGDLISPDMVLRYDNPNYVELRKKLVLLQHYTFVVDVGWLESEIVDILDYEGHDMQRKFSFTDVLVGVAKYDGFDILLLKNRNNLEHLKLRVDPGTFGEGHLGKKFVWDCLENPHIGEGRTNIFRVVKYAEVS